MKSIYTINRRWAIGLLIGSFIFVSVQSQTNIKVYTPQPEMLTANAGKDTSIVVKFTATLGGDPTAKGGTQPYSYSWTPADGLDSDTISNPFAWIQEVSTKNYTLLVTDNNGCTATDEVTINATLSVEEMFADDHNHLALFPLPADEYLNVKFQKTVIRGSWMILSIEGKIIDSGDEFYSKNQFEIKMPQQEGMYIIKVIADDKEYIEKIVKK